MDQAKRDAAGSGYFMRIVWRIRKKGFIYLEDYLAGMWAAQDGRYR